VRLGLEPVEACFNRVEAAIDLEAELAEAVLHFRRQALDEAVFELAECAEVSGSSGG